MASDWASKRAGLEGGDMLRRGAPLVAFGDDEVLASRGGPLGA
jgi:hypothetical protein